MSKEKIYRDLMLEKMLENGKVSSTSDKMDAFEKKLSQDDEVKTAFNVLQALWKSRGEKDMKMVVEMGGIERNGRKTEVQLEITVKAKYL